MMSEQEKYGIKCLVPLVWSVDSFREYHKYLWADRIFFRRETKDDIVKLLASMRKASAAMEHSIEKGSDIYNNLNVFIKKADVILEKYQWAVKE